MQASTAITNHQYGNALLDSLPPEMLDALRLNFVERHLIAGQTLYPVQCMKPAESVYFPVTAITSMGAALSDGSHVEALPVGFEGVAAFEAVLGSPRTLDQWICSISGSAIEMPVADLFTVLNTDPDVGRILLCYSQSLVTTLAYSVACHAKHSLLQRCAKWLLLTHDRVQSDELAVTHEFLAILLGVRRAGVSTVAAELQVRGAIRYSRGRIRIIDRAGLEAISCECYSHVTEEYNRLMLRTGEHGFGPRTSIVGKSESVLGGVTALPLGASRR